MKRVISPLAICLKRKNKMGKNENKEKKAIKDKKKVVYIDDGSTVSSMSAFGGKKKDEPRLVRGNTFKDQFKTFTDAQKAMFLPMLAFLGIIALAFFIVYILL